MIEASLTAAGLAGAGLLAYAARCPRSSLLAPSVWRGPGGRRAVALTFDDGPSEETPALLELLAAHGARATFFQIGANVRRLPGVARQVAAAGHEIGNHSDTHAALWLRGPGFIRAEVGRAQAAFAGQLGLQPRLYRAPYGVRWFGLGAAQRECGLTGVMWSTIALDWKLPAPAIAARLERGLRDGAIFCLHDGAGTRPHPDRSATRAALAAVLPRWRAAGWRLLTVSELLG